MLKSFVEVKEVQKRNVDFEKLNNTIHELKELKEYGTVLAKLIEIRSKNRISGHIDTHFASIKKLNDLIELVENRKIKYQADKNTLKGLNFLLF